MRRTLRISLRVFRRAVPLLNLIQQAHLRRGNCVRIAPRHLSGGLGLPDRALGFLRQEIPVRDTLRKSRRNGVRHARGTARYGNHVHSRQAGLFALPRTAAAMLLQPRTHLLTQFMLLFCGNSRKR